MDRESRPGSACGVLFRERRRGSIVFWASALAFPALGLYGLTRIPGATTGAQVWFLALFSVLFPAFVLWGFLGPIGGEFKHLRVDDQGLWVRSRLLPAGQIGEVRRLSEREAFAATSSSRIDGTWLIRGVATYSHFSSHGHAVFVRQHLVDGRTRPWLLATWHPDELVAAIEQVRDGAAAQG